MPNVLSLKLNLPTGNKKENASPEYKDKIFVAVPPRGRLVRKAMELSEKITDENGKTKIDTSTLDEILQFTVDLFDNRFTLDDLYDGVLAENLMSTAMDSLNFVMGKLSDKAKKSPNAGEGK
jgi:hypothetical protein